MKKYIGKILAIFGVILIVESLALTNIFHESEEFLGSFGLMSCFPGILFTFLGVILSFRNKGAEATAMEEFPGNRKNFLLGLASGIFPGLILGMLLPPVWNTVFVIVSMILYLIARKIPKIADDKIQYYFLSGFILGYLSLSIIGICSKITYVIINTPISD